MGQSRMSKWTDRPGYYDARRSRTSHLKTGDKLGYAGDVVTVAVTCTAGGAERTEPLDADAKIKDALAGLTCGSCGRCGRMQLARKGAA